MSDRVHIAVVDDERDIRDTIAEYLDINGFQVSTADGGTALRQLVEQAEIDLVILDITMPGEDGLSLCRFLRGHGAYGIIMLTARSDVVDRIIGIEMGADDYVPKPFDLRELLARIKAVLRRTRAGGSAGGTAGERIQFGRCALDLDAHKLLDSDGVEIPITSMEYDLLRTFAERPNRVLSREQLLDLAHNRDGDPFDRSIDIRIARLRQKIEPDPKRPTVIRTVRGAGYLFAGDASTP